MVEAFSGMPAAITWIEKGGIIQPWEDVNMFTGCQILNILA